MSSGKHKTRLFRCKLRHVFNLEENVKTKRFSRQKIQTREDRFQKKTLILTQTPIQLSIKANEVIKVTCNIRII